MDPYVGEVKLMGFGFAPKGWALCNGALLAIQQNAALFSLLGTNYGGNGTTNFALPDLRGRAAIHMGNGYVEGQIAGVENVSLTLPTMPMHNHSFGGVSQNGTQKPPTGALLAQTSSTTDKYYASDATLQPLVAASVGQIGGNIAHNNMQPFLVLNYCIALVGLYPSRN